METVRYTFGISGDGYLPVIFYRFKEAEYSNTGKITGWKPTDVTSLKQDRLSFFVCHTFGEAHFMQDSFHLLRSGGYGVKVTVTDIGVSGWKTVSFSD